VGPDVKYPVLIFNQGPEYSEEARKAKWQGSLLLSVIVDETGHPQQIKVSKSLGLGLDQKAIEAVEKWRFNPARKAGKAVPMQVQVAVEFQLP
jgi:protein TonB